MLKNFDFEHGLDCEYDEFHWEESNEPMTAITKLHRNSLVYLAGIVEEKVILAIKSKGKKACTQCMNVFAENYLVEDDFIEFKAKTSNILQPCKSTVEIIQYVEKTLEKYSSQNASFNSTLTHIVSKMDPLRFYGTSVFDDSHNHHSDFVRNIVSTYLDLVSKNRCRVITRLSHEKLIRHEHLKNIHRAGQ